jgi:hypothetical protein
MDIIRGRAEMKPAIERVVSITVRTNSCRGASVCDLGSETLPATPGACIAYDTGKRRRISPMKNAVRTMIISVLRIY